MELSEQLARFLSAEGFGIFDPDGITGNIFINSSPDQPDQSLTIYTTGGPGSVPSNEYKRVNIQVLIRTIPNDPRAGETSAQRLIDTLNGFNSSVLITGGNYIYDVTAIQSGPNNIGNDAKNRVEYSQNFTFEYLN